MRNGSLAVARGCDYTRIAKVFARAGKGCRHDAVRRALECWFGSDNFVGQPARRLAGGYRMSTYAMQDVYLRT